MSYQEVRVQYIMTLLISILLCTGLFVFGGYWIPEKFSQQHLLEDPTFYRGIGESLLVLEEKIQRGQFPLEDNVPYRVRDDVSEALITKMHEEKKSSPYTKYRVELRFRYPYSVISRSTKLDAILVDVSPEQNHDFADLFWNLQ